MFSQLISAQERVVHGVVKDSLGSPIPGVNIVVKGTSIEAQTDLDGLFKIKARSSDTLNFSFTGMKDQKVLVDKTEINVILYNQKPIEPDCDEEFFGAQKRILRTLPRGYKKNNPKTDFKKHIEINSIGIYLVNASVLCKIDHAFEKKFGIRYYRTYFSRDEYEAIAYNRNEEYTKAYNKLVYKYLNKKFKKEWQAGIRKEAVGLKEFLN